MQVAPGSTASILGSFIGNRIRLTYLLLERHQELALFLEVLLFAHVHQVDHRLSSEEKVLVENDDFSLVPFQKSDVLALLERFFHLFQDLVFFLELFVVSADVN